MPVFIDLLELLLVPLVVSVDLPELLPRHIIVMLAHIALLSQRYVEFGHLFVLRSQLPQLIGL